MRTPLLLGIVLSLAFTTSSGAQVEAESAAENTALEVGGVSEEGAQENATANGIEENTSLESAASESAALESAAPETAAEPPVIYAVPASAPAPSEAPEMPASPEPAEPVPSESTEAGAPEEAPRLVLATTLGGLAGVVGGFGLSWGPSFGLAGTNQDAFTARVSAYVMGVTTWGTPLTTAVGIFSAGQAAGGNANFGVTLLGTSLGGIVGGGLAGIFYAADHSQALTLVGVLSIPALQWAGGVLAYHLSHRARGRAAEAPEFPETQSLPSLSIRPGGATLGWSGSF